jgi:alpha-tubulin suppressor-like RCC1 family protein
MAHVAQAVKEARRAGVHGRRRDVVSWGYNYFLQVSGDVGELHVLEPRRVPLALDVALVQAPSVTSDVSSGSLVESADRPVAVSAGGHFTLLLTERGAVFCWGTDFSVVRTSAREPSARLSFPGLAPRLRVVMVSAGKKHAGCVSEDGQVFTWGCGYFGRLGHGSESSVEQPKRVEYLWDACRHANESGDNFDGSVYHISCGGAHTAVATTNGLVYMWGFNSFFQCGKSGDKRGNLLLPRRLETGGSLPEDECVTAIYCGRQHSMLLTEQGSVYSFGHAAYGRLGHANFSYSTKVVSFPKRIEAFSGTDADTSVFKLALGANHTLALTCSGKVLAWGRNDVGQCGLGHLTDQRTPALIALPGLGDCVVSDVQCGDQHSLAVASPRETGGAQPSEVVYMWGVGFGGGGSSASVAFDVEDVWVSPTRVALGPGLQCMHASLGGAHTVVIVESLVGSSGGGGGGSGSAGDAGTPGMEHLDGDGSHDVSMGDATFAASAAVEPAVERAFSFCRHGRLAQLRSALQHLPVDVRDANGNTLLITASQNGLLNVVRWLIEERGADPAASNNKGLTALHYAREYSFRDVQEFLLQRRGAT